MILYLARRYDEAIEQFHKTLEIDPNFFRATSGLDAPINKRESTRRLLKSFKRQGNLITNHWSWRRWTRLCRFRQAR